jgi:hypothetical protein
MNLAQGQNAVMARGFDYLPAPRLTDMLNAGKDTFEDAWEWPWLAKVFVGPTPAAIPDLKLMLMVTSGGSELLGLDLRQVAQDGTNLNAPGSPEYWWIESGTAERLHAWPGDGAVVSAVYLADTPALVNPGDTPLIPARYHSLWIDLAVCEAYKDSDNFAAAQALRADVNVRMYDVIARYEVRNRQHSPMMSVRRPYGEDE